MIYVKYSWIKDGAVTERTIKQITVPRVGETVNFNAGGRQIVSVVKDVKWVVNEIESKATVYL